MSTNAYIYCLLDPETHVVRWIGSTQDPEKRLSQHWYLAGRANQALRTWLTMLKERGTKPLMVILEETTQEQRYIREQYWLDVYKHTNADMLFNRYPVPIYTPRS